MPLWQWHDLQIMANWLLMLSPSIQSMTLSIGPRYGLPPRGGGNGARGVGAREVAGAVCTERTPGVRPRPFVDWSMSRRAGTGIRGVSIGLNVDILRFSALSCGASRATIGVSLIWLVGVAFSLAIVWLSPNFFRRSTAFLYVSCSSTSSKIFFFFAFKSVSSLRFFWFLRPQYQ